MLLPVFYAGEIDSVLFKTKHKLHTVGVPLLPCRRAEGERQADGRLVVIVVWAGCNSGVGCL